MQRSRKLLFTATFLLLHVGARGEVIQIGTVLETTNNAVNFNLVTSNTTNQFLTPFVFNITETITLPDGSTVNTGPFQDFPGSFVNTDVASSNALATIWSIDGQFSVQQFTLSDGRTIFPDSTTFTVAGGTAPIGQSLTVPILISGSTVPEPNQSLLIALGLILFLAARLFRIGAPPQAPGGIKGLRAAAGLESTNL